jgi:hemerythrin-like domain-containing protein
MKITEALMAEHLVFHTMFDHIEASVTSLKTVGEIKSLAGLLEAMLKTHADAEDQLFLGPLEHCFEQIGQRDSFLEEHQEMDQHLKLVQRATRLKEAQSRLLSAVAHSRRHFDREERIVFPIAEHAMKAQTLRDLGENWIRQRTNLGIQPRRNSGSLPRSPSSQYQQSVS